MANLNHAQIVKDWAPAIKQIVGNNINESRVDWMCELAHTHARHLNEAAAGGTFFPVQTLFNTNGIGNPVPASAAGMTAAQQGANNTTGSGDKWNVLMPIALQVAARTVGFDLVNTFPLQAPNGVIPYMDYIYAGSKDVYGASPATNGATANPQGAYTKYDALHAFRCVLDASAGATKKDCMTEMAGLTKVTLTGNGKTLEVKFIAPSRLTAEPMFRVLPGQETVSIGEVFGADAKVDVSLASTKFSLVKPRAISALEDQLQGFAGSGPDDNADWSGTYRNPKVLFEPMERGTGEMQYPRQMSVKMFTKWVTCGTQQVAVAVTQEMVQDLQKQWGVDVVKMIQNEAINELSQSINRHILDRLFALGWKNHYRACAAEGMNFNIDFTGAGTTTVKFASYEDERDAASSALPEVKLFEMNVPAITTYGTNTFENQDTMIKRLATCILGASDAIMNRGRRGPGTYVVCNARVSSLLRSNAQYGFSPLANTLSQNNGNLYPVGTLCGMTVYTDPTMAYWDTRILVGRKGEKQEPQVMFCPYIMAESVQLIAEQTGAPKVLVKSRYALVNVGWYPELNYFTIFAKLPESFV